MGDAVDLEPFGLNDLKVEVTVRAGDVHGVQLATVVDLPDYRNPKARARLREIITLLFDALPLTELQARDKAYPKETPDLGVTADGKLTIVPKGSALVRAGQEDLKRKLQSIQNPGASA